MKTLRTISEICFYSVLLCGIVFAWITTNLGEAQEDEAALEERLLAYNDRNVFRANFTTYLNLDERLSIDYPSNWRTFQARDSPMVLKPDIVILSSHQPKTQQATPEHLIVITVSVQDISMSLNNYTISAIQGILQFTNGSRIMEFTETSLSGIEAHRIIGTYVNNGHVIQVMDMWTLKDNKLYRITSYSNPDYFSQDLHLIRKIADSFKILSEMPE